MRAAGSRPRTGISKVIQVFLMEDKSLNGVIADIETTDHHKSILINVSESHVADLPPTAKSHLISHALQNLRRIYPRGTRITSSNLDILKFWRNGSHIASLNWQHYDRNMQVNEAMFAGSPGWVLK